MEGVGSRGWWDLKLVKRVATVLWLGLDKFVGRVDLKADWTVEMLEVLSVLFEEGNAIGKVDSKDLEAVRTALDRYAEALKLKLAGRRLC